MRVRHAMRKLRKKQGRKALAFAAAGPRIAYSVDIVRYKQGLKCLRTG